MALDIGALFGGLDRHRADLLDPRHGPAVPQRAADGRRAACSSRGSSSPRSSSSCSTCSPTCCTACSTRGSGSHDVDDDLERRAASTAVGVAPARPVARWRRRVRDRRRTPSRGALAVAAVPAPVPPPQGRGRRRSSSWSLLIIVCFGAELLRAVPEERAGPPAGPGVTERQRTGSAPTSSAATSSPRCSTPGRSR